MVGLEITDIEFYNRIFDLYIQENNIGDLLNIDGDYLVECTYLYCKPEFSDYEIVAKMYQVYGLDKGTMSNKPVLK